MALSGTISGTYRGYTIQTTWTAKQNIAGNYSDITATHKLICDSTYALYIDGRTNSCTVDGTAKSFTSPAISTAGGQTISLGTTTHRVYHNANGSKSFTMTTVFNMQATIVSTYIERISATGTITLNTIPRQATITGANNFNDEQNPYFTFSNAGGFNMTAELTFAGKTISRTGLGNATSGNYTFKLTDAERTTLRNATPNSNTMTVTYTLKTTISGTVYSSSIAKTMTIVNANPTAPTVYYLDTNADTVAITGDSGRIVQKHSDFRAIVHTTTGKKGATIVEYKTTISGITKTGYGNLDFGKLNIASNTELVTIVKDSRGNTAKTVRNIIVDAWKPPTALNYLYRINNYEADSRLRVDCSYSSVNGKNTISCVYRYKKTTESEFISWQSISNNTVKELNLDNTADFNFEVRINDKFGAYVTYTLFLPKGRPIAFIDVWKNSVGVNKFPENNNALDVYGNIFVNSSPVVERGSNDNGEWVKFYDGTMICRNSIKLENKSVSVAWGSLFVYNDSSTKFYFAEPFLNTPIISITGGSILASNGYWLGDYGGRETTPSYWSGYSLIRPTSGSVSVYLNVIAIGRWK